MATAEGNCPFHSRTTPKAEHVIEHEGKRYDLCGPCFKKHLQHHPEVLKELITPTMTQAEQEEAMWRVHG